MNRLPLLPLAALCFSLLFPPAAAWAQPALSRAVPAAVQPGQTTLVTLHGAKLEGVARVWTSFPAQVEVQPEGTAAQVACKITLPADVPPGVGGLIVASPTGASGVLLLAVDDLTSVVDGGNNHSQSQAQPLDMPVAVDGLMDGSQADLYRVEGRAGQRLAAEVYAGRLGSAADPVIRLLNAQGNELRMSDDEPGLGSDGRFEFTFPEDGPYYLQVHDNRYQAGGFYRLRVGDFPLVNTPYPLGARRGSTVQFRFAKVAPAETEPLLLRVPTDAGGSWGLAARYPDGESSAIARLLLSDVPECLEREPNEQPEVASPLVIPAAANGRLETDGDVDTYAFQAKGARPLDVQAAAARVGSPAVPLLAIKSADGKTLAESTFGEVADPQLRFTPPADGTYHLVVQELLGRGGPEFSYRVEINDAPPFQLSLKNDKDSTLIFTLAEGNGAVTLPVECARSGYDGPIELSLEDPSSGLRLYNTTVAAKANAAQPVLVVPDPFRAGDLHVVRLVGTATVDGRPWRAVLSTSAVVRTKQPAMLYVPEWLDGRLTLATKAGPAAAPFSVTVDPATILMPRSSLAADCLVRVERTDKEFKEALQIFLGDLPAGVSAEVKKEEKEGEEAWRVTLKAAPGTPVSLNPIRLTAYATFKGTGFAVDHHVPLKVFDPLRAELEIPGPLNAGGKQPLRVRLTREGADPQPVTLRVEGLPGEVTAPAEVTVPADQAEATIELTAGEGAAAGTHPLVIVARTTYQGQELEVKGLPGELHVAKP